MFNTSLFSSKTNEWATPQAFFDELNTEFHFTLDPCARHDNAKCERYYTIEDDGLTKNWGGGCSAILRTAGKLGSGSRSAMRRVNDVRSWLCLSRPGQTLHIFMIISTIRRKKYASSVVGFTLTNHRRVHHSRVWWSYSKKTAPRFTTKGGQLTK